MVDEVTRITREGWGERLGGSFKGIVVGILMVFGGIGLLFWGEGRAVKRAKALAEGSAAVITVDASGPSAGNEGNLVHFTGRTDAYESISDPIFGIESDALKLERQVEMYQWAEEKESKKKKNTGGSTETVTTYRYKKEWSSKVINSSNFEQPSGHENPSSMAYPNKTFTADPIVIGDWVLGHRFVAKLTKKNKLRVGEADLERAPAEIRRKARLADGDFYFGEDPSSPSIGDLRIRFATVPRAEVSVVGQQRGQGLEPYTAKVGGDIALLSYGTKTSEEMFDAAKAGNATLTWVLRLVGFGIIMVGFMTILRPLTVAADLIPFLGNLAEKGVGLAAFVLAAMVSLVTIAIGWIFYRPLLGIALLALAVGLVVWLMKRAAANPSVDKWTGKSSAAPPPPPPAGG